MFDVARRLLVVEVEHGREVRRAEAVLGQPGATSRLQRLAEVGADVLICEAISQPLEAALVSAGVKVTPHTCGPVEDVVKAFVSGRLKDDTFVMPGCGGRRRRETSDHHAVTLHFLINDIFMALFFGIAAKEVRESFLPGGALSNPRKAATPLLATLGGIVGPASLFLLGAWTLGGWGDLNRGWAIPCATDIAFSYLAARLIFGKGHPAIAFLLLLAIADDAAGLAILAVAYPQSPIQPVWFLLTTAAILTGFGFRKLGLRSFWWYLAIPGLMSWLSFFKAGVHPALGLVPIVAVFPHAHTDLGIFARGELKRHNALDEFEHWWKNPVELILGLFGLANAGVVLSSMGVGTWLVLVGLLVGKPLGITLFTWVSEKAFGLKLPSGMDYRHVVTLGTVAGIGFTVALFVSTAAFAQPGPIQDSVKMGALLSFAASGLAFVVARILGVNTIAAAEPRAQGEPTIAKREMATVGRLS